MATRALKGELREQAYHPGKVGGDEIYVRRPRSEHYEMLGADFYQEIVAGNAGC